MHNCQYIILLTYYATCDLQKNNNKIYCSRLSTRETVDATGFRQQLSTRRRLKHLSCRSRLIILCTLERGMPVSREISQAERCALACPPDWARQVVHLLNVVIVYTLNAVCRCLFAWQLYPSCGFSSADYRCFQVSNSCLPIHSTVFVHHTALTDRDL